MTADTLNGAFEAIGSLMIWRNVIALHRDKMFRGVRIAPVVFWALWGIWNLYYYPHLGQWLSFFGGCSVVLANVVWCCQMVYCRGR